MTSNRYAIFHVIDVDIVPSLVQRLDLPRFELWMAWMQGVSQSFDWTIDRSRVWGTEACESGGYRILFSRLSAGRAGGDGLYLAWS